MKYQLVKPIIRLKNVPNFKRILNTLSLGVHINVSTLPNVKTDIMDTTKLTREEALRRWKASKETKRKMMEKQENLEMNAHGKGL